MSKFKRFTRIFLALIMAAVPLATIMPSQIAHAAQDTCTWTGIVDGNWNQLSNWSCSIDGSAVPETDDDIVFPSSASNLNMNNNIAIIPRDITVQNSSYVFNGNTVELSRNLNAFSSPTFNSTVRFSAISGTAQLNVQGGTPTFTNPVDLNLTGTAGFFVFTTNASLDLPSFTGTTGVFTMMGNPTAPHEIFNSSTTASTFTSTNGVNIFRSTFSCQANGCLGNNANNVTVGLGDSTGATLELDDATLNLANNLTLDSTGGSGPSGVSTAQTATLSGLLNLTTDSTITTGAGSPLVINGTTSLGANTLTYGGAAEVVQNGTVTGSGNVVSNVAALTLVNGNSYTGLTTIMPGARVNVMAANSLGTTAGVTTVQNGGSVIFSPLLGPITVAENFTVSGTGDSGISGAISTFDNTDTTTLTGTITLAGDTTFGIGLAGSDLVINGVLAGTGDITFNTVAFGSDLILGGAVPNTYSGTITVTGSFLNLQKNGAVTGDIIIADNGINAFVVKSPGLTDAIADTAIVTFNENSSANFSVDNGESETISALAGDEGNVFIGTGGTLTLNTSGTHTFDGSFAGGGTLAKAGPGTQTLSGSCAVSGFITILAGTLVTTSDFITSSCDVTVNGGIFKAAGQLEDVIGTSGTISAGNSPGTANVSGNYTLSSGMTFEEEIAGPTAGSQYDQTIVTGTATLGSATLSIAPSYTPAAGTTFTIIQAGSVSGTFNGLPDGATVSVNGLNFRINYTGTTVVLTYLSGTLTAPGGLAETGIEALGILLLSIGLIASAFAVIRRNSHDSV